MVRGAAVKEQIVTIRQNAPAEGLLNLDEQDLIILPGFGNTVRLVYVYDCNIIFAQQKVFIANTDIH
jgi:hypothetical protein